MTATKDYLPRPQVQAAAEALAEARQNRMNPAGYRTVARMVPGLLQRHGLGLTLAYLQMRGAGNPNSPYELVYRQLDRWLQKSMGVSARGFLGVLCNRDSGFYLEASGQAWFYARALAVCVEEQP